MCLAYFTQHPLHQPGSPSTIGLLSIVSAWPPTLLPERLPSSAILVSLRPTHPPRALLTCHPYWAGTQSHFSGCGGHVAPGVGRHPGVQFSPTPASSKCTEALVTPTTCSWAGSFPTIPQCARDLTLIPVKATEDHRMPQWPPLKVPHHCLLLEREV